MARLTLDALKREATMFAQALSTTPIPALYGASDGKAVGAHVEVQVREHLKALYEFTLGSAAAGIDFPDIDVDVKATSIKQPQSSCPFKNASQKVFGLGYHLLVFVYEKTDVQAEQASYLLIKHLIFVPRELAADFQTTKGLRGILARGGNEDDIVAFLEERNLPLDEIGRQQLAQRILIERPALGCLTISNALQWRLQYGRAIVLAGQFNEDGPEELLA